MAARAKQGPAAFDPGAFRTFRFLARDLDAGGAVTLSYALGEELTFTERVTVPLAAPLSEEAIAAAQGLLALLHWVAGVSYYKAALPEEVRFEGPAPAPAAARRRCPQRAPADAPRAGTRAFRRAAGDGHGERLAAARRARF